AIPVFERPLKKAPSARMVHCHGVKVMAAHHAAPLTRWQLALEFGVALSKQGAQSAARQLGGDCRPSLSNGAPERGWNCFATLNRPDCGRIDENSYAMKRACGGVLIDESGRVLLRKPKDLHKTRVWTFAKGKPEPGETAEQT